jgi:hypothetical protein
MECQIIHVVKRMVEIATKLLRNCYEIATKEEPPSMENVLIEESSLDIRFPRIEIKA